MKEIQKILSSLEHTADVNEQYQAIDRLAKAGEVGSLTELYQSLLDTNKSRNIPEWAIRSVANQIIKSLSLSAGVKGAVKAVELAQTQAVTNTRNASRIAAMLASTHTTQVLVTVFRQLSTADKYYHFLAELIQEMVVYGHNCSSVGEFNEFWITKKKGDEIYWLPLSLSDIEQKLPLRRYSSRGSGSPMPFGPSHGNTPKFIEGSNIQLKRIMSKSTKVLIETALENWTTESNGKVFSELYQIKSLSQMTEINLKLPLEILEQVGGSKAVVTKINASEGFRIIFGAAANGGAYNYGVYGAKGRLLAWKSISGLVGRDWPIAFDELLKVSKSCDWYSVEVDSEWFYQVAWDLGLIVHSPLLNTLGVLFATDTD